MIRLANMFRILSLCLCLVGPAACTSFPEVSQRNRVTTDQPPVLVPVDGILQQADALSDGNGEISSVEARAAALRARAERLRRQ